MSKKQRHLFYVFTAVGHGGAAMAIVAGGLSVGAALLLAAASSYSISMLDPAESRKPLIALGFVQLALAGAYALTRLVS
jgi:hypothetical protein